MGVRLHFLFDEVVTDIADDEVSYEDVLEVLDFIDNTPSKTTTWTELNNRFPYKLLVWLKLSGLVDYTSSMFSDWVEFKAHGRNRVKPSLPRDKYDRLDLSVKQWLKDLD